MSGERGPSPKAGWAAEFGAAETLLAAVHALWHQGFYRLDAFTPYPVAGLDEALRLGRSSLNWRVFVLGMGGALAGFFIMVYCNAWSYPINVGGRPALAIPAFIPITFESGVLVSAVAALGLLFRKIGLPHLAHPLFSVPGFERASIDRFWLVVDRHDPKADEQTPALLAQLGATRVAYFGKEPS